MIISLLGYPFIMLIFLILRFFYHILPKKNSDKNLIQAVKSDFLDIYDYVKQIILSNPKKIKMIFVITVVLIIFPLIPFKNEIMDVVEDILGAILCSLFVIIFSPTENPTHKEFPVEIFGFIYSIIFMFYSAGLLVFDIFYTNNFFKEDIWIYGYIITVISYVVCIATLRRFIERDLMKEEIILLGMIMMTTLEFITYYGIGYFSRIEGHNVQAFESNIFGDITSIINQGIFIASQSQILERSPMEIWGYIILNGTDALTITVVLGYLLQKFMENKSSTH